jgi:PKD repeat protein
MMRGRSNRIAVCIAGLAFGAIALGGCSLFRLNQAPIASFTATPSEGYRPVEVAFDASASIDPDGDALTYAWSFGDGGTSSDVRVAHAFESVGSYDVVLRVADPEGLQDVCTAAIDVHEVPEGYVVCRYEWTWGGEDRALDVALPWNLYQTYRGRLRIPYVDNYDYGVFVEDSLDDPTLADLADLLSEGAGEGGLAFAEFALAFVQGGIAYKADPSDVEWPLYPLETLVDREGDCEDTAILYVSLLKARGTGCRLAFVDTDDDGLPDHVLALVAVAGLFVERPGVTLFELDGTQYAVAETASGAIELGVDPWGLDVEDLIELWAF